MKKNFLKKLAFTMAFATAFTALSPAAGVFAAKAPSLTVGKTLTLLLGTEDRASHDINVNNKVPGSKYAWKSNNTKVATVNAKNGIVTGKTTGTAKVTLSITLPGVKKAKTLTTTVNVKNNITEVAIKNAPEAPIKVGEVYDFNRTIVSTAAGKTVAPHKGAITRWEIVSENKADASIDDAGNFVATKGGEYEIVAKTFQSKAKYADYLNGKKTDIATSESVKINVLTSMVAKQVDLVSFTLTLDSKVEKLADNLKVYSVVGSTKVLQTVKSVDVKDNVATVTLYVPFAPEVQYVAELAGATEANFTAAKTGAEDVAAVEVVTKEVVVGEGKDLEVKLLTKDNVDITKSGTLSTRVTYESSSDKVFLTGKNLTIFTKGEATTITATFHSYKYDTTTGAEIDNVKGSGVVVGVDKTEVTVGSISAWTISKDTPNFTDAPKKIAAEDRNYRVFVKSKASNNNDVDSANDPKFTFESSNESILMVYSTGHLVPIKAGNVVIIVKYDGKVIGTLDVTVAAKRVATTLTLDAYNFALSNAAFGDSKTLKIKVVDQLGDTVDLNNVDVQKLAGSPASNIARIVNNEVVVAGVGATRGLYHYKVMANGLERVISVTIQQPSSTTPSSYGLEVSGTEFDTAVNADSYLKDIDVNVFGYAGGVKTTNETNNSKFVVKITGGPNNIDHTVVNGKFALTSVSSTSVSGSVITKVAEGNYRVTVYEVTDNGEVARDVKYFTVKDTQAKPVLAEVKKVSTDKTTLVEAIRDSFKFTLNGVDVTANVTPGEILSNGSNAAYVFVKNVKYNQELTTVGGRTIYVEHTIAVNNSLTYTP